MRFSDEELMVMFASGTAEALSMLYERYRHRIYRFAIGCLGSPADAEDTVQDVFLRVATAAARYKPSDRFKAWLFQIAANRIRDIGRQRMLRNKCNLPANPGTAAESGDRGRFEQKLIALDALQRLLTGLDPDEKILLTLKELEGMDSASIADVMGLTPEAVRVRMHRIRAGLKAAAADADEARM